MGWNMLDNVSVHPHTSGKKNLVPVEGVEISVLVKVQSTFLLTRDLIWYFNC